MKKQATNVNQTIPYVTIVSLEMPTSKVAVDEDGNKYMVAAEAEVGDVLVFDNDQPTWMPFEFFKVGRTV
jgi:hypothetical protein